MSAMPETKRPPDIAHWLPPTLASRALAALTGQPPLDRRNWTKWAKRDDVRGWREPLTGQWFIDPAEPARLAREGLPERRKPGRKPGPEPDAPPRPRGRPRKDGLPPGSAPGSDAENP